MEQKSQKTKKIREKETAILDSVSPKFNRNMIAYHETGDLFANQPVPLNQNRINGSISYALGTFYNFTGIGK